MSAPLATYTCWSGSSGSVSVPPAGTAARRVAAAVPSRAAAARSCPDATGTSSPSGSVTGAVAYEGGAPDSSGGSQTWTNGSARSRRGRPRVDHARPGREHLDLPRALVAALGVGVHQGPGEHPRHDLEVGVRVVGEALGAQQVVVVADDRAESDVLGVVVLPEREGVPGGPTLLP